MATDVDLWSVLGAWMYKCVCFMLMFSGQTKMAEIMYRKDHGSDTQGTCLSRPGKDASDFTIACTGVDYSLAVDY